MLNLVFATEIGIFVTDGVVRVRVRRHDGLEGHTRQGLDVGFGQDLVQPLLAHPPHIVPGIRFALVQNAKIHPGIFHQSGELLCHLLIARVKRSVVTHEPQ